MDRIKLLIINDEIVVQESCVDIFSEKSDSYDITTVSSGEEALLCLDNKKMTQFWNAYRFQTQFLGFESEKYQPRLIDCGFWEIIIC